MYTLNDKNDKFIELQDDNKTLLIPTNKAIIVDDESDFNAIKSISCRKTIAIYHNSTPPTPPAFQGKWKATYTGGNVTSAECDSSSAITFNEITSTDLESVEVGDCVTRIDDYAFVVYSNLVSVTIGTGVTYIGTAAFQSCDSLTSVTVNATTPPTLGAETFFYTSSALKIYVPASSVEAYKSASEWRWYASMIQPIQE